MPDPNKMKIIYCSARFFGDLPVDLDVKTSRRRYGAEGYLRLAGRDLPVDLDVKTSRRRYGAERADPRCRPVQARRRYPSAKKPRGKANRGGRDPQIKTWPDTPKSLFIRNKYQVLIKYQVRATVNTSINSIPGYTVDQFRRLQPFSLATSECRSQIS